MIWIRGKKFYFFLRSGRKDSLEDNEAIGNNDIIVRWETERTSQLFARFDSPGDIYRFQLDTKPEERTFYEVIFGDKAQKPHFDIDVSLESFPEFEHNSMKIVDNLLETILSLGPPFDGLDPAKDFLIYSSHGKKKRSYHVLLHSIAHINNTDARKLYDKIVTRMDPNYSKFLDHAVYSPSQQFRLLGSSKLANLERRKILVNRFLFRGKEIVHESREHGNGKRYEEYNRFIDSLISDTTNCRLLEPDDSIEESKFHITDDVFSEKEELTISEIVEELYPNCFSIESIRGNLFVLKRKRPTFCESCLREHQHENPHLSVFRKEDGYIYVYFNCRRLDVGKKPYLIAQIKEDKVKKEEEKNVSIPTNLNDIFVASEKKRKEKKRDKPTTKELPVFFDRPKELQSVRF